MPGTEPPIAVVRRHRRIAVLALIAVVTPALAAQGPAALTVTPNLQGAVDKPLRYRPDAADFVIENGEEFFNRPLYGGHTGFRVDAGDLPEFTLYLPGRGGNLRLGFRTAAGVRWLFEADRVRARYRPGSMIYDVTDPALDGEMHVEVIALPDREGLVVRTELTGAAGPVELVWAYGGVTGQRGVRDGDIGTESVPISEYFQLQPQFCAGNTFEISGRTFALQSAPATIVGLVPENAVQAVADANQWASWDGLLASSMVADTPPLPVVIGRAPLRSGEPRFIALQRAAEGAAADPAPVYTPDELPAVFLRAREHFDELRERVAVDTPDPYLNAAVGALNVATDAVWDEAQGAVMHGAVAWRTRLLGWRGPYAQDALGWHDRARRHLAYWATRQNTDSIPGTLPPPDENSNLARSEAALHSNGDLSNSHYDMNAVYIDALFRHLQWTGDLDLARQLWPTIERHLAWERRLFRRPFGPEGAPLYEGYAMIWASDDLGYGGGGVTHASAYNVEHNRQAARLARLLGHDPAPYEQESQAIARAMRDHLWLADRGWFAEYKDLLGRQSVHPSAALWTVYHALDAGVATPADAWQLTRYVDTAIPHLPVRGPGVPADDAYHVLATSDWMPYSWSINNVVMGEVVHTALGYWKAARPDEAYRLVKGALLASMFMGICPGNVGSMNYLDVYRRESQRDFADGGGVLSRALIEGLFGIEPDLLDGVLRVTPGFPDTWDHASLRHPDVDLAFRRVGTDDHYTIETRFERAPALVLTLTARSAQPARVTIDGQPSMFTVDRDAVGFPRIRIDAAPALRREIVVTWTDDAIAPPPAPIGVERGLSASIPVPGVEVIALSDPQQVLRSASTSADGIRGEVAGTPGARTLFAQVRQGALEWWMPVALDVRTPESAGPAPTDWTRPVASSDRLEPVDLTSLFNDRVTQIFRNEYRSPRSPYVSLALPKQGIGAWAGHVNADADIDDSGLRAVAREGGGRLLLPNRVPFETPGAPASDNVIFASQWDNYPREVTVPIDGRARRVYLLMAGSTYWMQSQLDNGEVVVTYTDGGSARLALRNPDNWWPIDQDYFIDDFQFRRPGPIPPRVDLKTGAVRVPDMEGFKGTGGTVPGGSATVLELALDPDKALRSLTLRALANDVVIGLMAVTLER